MVNRRATHGTRRADARPALPFGDARAAVATRSRCPVNEQELTKRLETLRIEHRDLDAAIAALTEANQQSGGGDQLQIARLKKRKLRLKDQIAIVEDALLPDIIA